MRATIQAIALLGAIALTVTVPSVSAAHAKTQPIEFDRHAVYTIGSEPVLTERAARKVKTAGLKQIRRKHQKQHRQRITPAANYAVAQIVDHPIGCPRRAFCGCGTALYLLGKRVTEGGLAIAANWLSFPRVSCAPNMAAARPGHVFAIIECLGGNLALVYDPNSGGHKTRIHVRDLSHYAIVNPHVGQYAEARAAP